MVIFAGAAESTQPGGQATYLQVVVPQFPPFYLPVFPAYGCES
jgi:hypothetical protein